MAASPARLRRVLAPVFALCAALLIAGCASSGSPSEAQQAGSRPGAEGCIQDFDPNQDYFPVKSEVEHAENFSLRYENSYQVLTVNQPYPGVEAESYVLVHCGAPAPELPPELADAPQIEVPIRSMFAGSTTHVPMLAELGRLDVLRGLANATGVVSPEVNARIDDGSVTEYAPNFQVDTEVVLSENPDLVMAGGADDPAYATLRQAGIPVVANVEWREATPLGRAEWLMVMAALTGTEQRAAEVFDEIERSYQQTAQLASSAEPVQVLPGNMVGGTWIMPSGGSYVGRYIADAGGTYPWLDNPAGSSLQLAFEAVLARAGQARIWLANTTWQSRTDITAEDPRYALLTAFAEGEVWNANRALGPGGSNDYYERGVVRPDLVLADLVAILHPDLLPDHEFTFYQELTDG